MGQIHGTPFVAERLQRFTNLPKEGIESLFLSYNLLGETWGLTASDVKDIFARASFFVNVMKFSEEDLDTLFTCLDSDGNNKIDALEMILTLALLSGMDVVEKVQFAFCLFDFESVGSLSFHEVSLLLRSVILAGFKSFPFQPAFKPLSLTEVEKYSSIVYLSLNKSKEEKISCGEFQLYCTSHPSAKAWLNYFSNSSDVFKPTSNIQIVKDFEINEQVCLATNPYSLTLSTSSKITANTGVKSIDTNWISTADKQMPEELENIRVDPPEDVFRPSWVHGINCGAKFCGPPAVYNSNGEIVYSASRHILLLSRDEQNAWRQSIISYHKREIIALAATNDGKIIVSAESSISPMSSQYDQSTRVCVWDVTKSTLLITISLPKTARVTNLTINGSGTLLLILYEDFGKCIFSCYSITGELFFETILESSGSINGISFLGTSSVIAIATSSGLDLYVDETSPPPLNGLLAYEKRSALYQSVGKAAIGKAVTAISRFENPDELVTGTENGLLLLWRGRSCVFALPIGESAKILSLHYSESSGVLLCLSADGTLSTLTSETFSKIGRSETDQFSSRSLNLIQSVGLIFPGVTPASLTYAVISNDGCKAVVISSTSGELYEISLQGSTLSEIASNEAIPEAEGDEIDAKDETHKKRFGSDLNDGPIVLSVLNAGGLVQVPSLPSSYITYSKDGSLSLWAVSLSEEAPSVHKRLRSVELDSGIDNVVSSNSVLAVALNGNLLSSRQGIIMLFNLEDFSFIMEIGENQGKQIADVIFSVDGSSLFVFSKEGACNSYSLLEGKYVFQTSFLLECSPRFVDLSTDGQFIRVQTTDSRLLFSDMTGVEITDSEMIKSVSWLTFTCMFSWDTKGVFNNASDTSIICNARMNHLFVYSESGGIVSALRVPCPNFSPHSNSSIILPKFHSGDIIGMAFVNDGKTLVTLDDTSNLLVTWDVSYDLDEFEPDKAEEDLENEEVGLDEDEEATMLPMISEDGIDEDLIDGDGFNADILDFKVEQDLTSIKKWAKNINLDVLTLHRNDDVSVKSEVLLPSYDMKPEWVSGYSCRLTRQSVWYSETGAIVYPAGSLGIIYNKSKGTQSLVSLNSDEITCLSVNVLGDLAVSGQRNVGDVFIVLWRIENGLPIRRINLGAVGGVSASAFSADSRMIVFALQDSDHTVLVYDWVNDLLLSKMASGDKKILNISCSFRDTLRFVCGHDKGFYLFEMAKGSNTLSRKTGLFGQEMRKTRVTCSVSLPQQRPTDENIAEQPEFILGLASGSIGVILKDDKRISRYVSINPGAVTAISTAVADGKLIKVVTGGVNGVIKVLDSEFEILQTYNLYLPPKDPTSVDHGLHPQGRAKGFRSLCVDRLNRKVLYGTAGGEIGEFDLETGRNINAAPLVESHFRHCLEALTVHPIRWFEFATAGDDKTLRTWSLLKHSVLNQIDLPNPGKAVAFSPNGQLVVVGMAPSEENNASVAIVSYLQGDLRIVHTTLDANAEVSCVSFNPEGSILFAASKDCVIYVYNALDNFKIIKKLSKHEQPVLALDLSLDGKNLVSYGHSEVFVWEISSLSLSWNDHFTPEMLRTTHDWYLRKGTKNHNLVSLSTNTSALAYAKQRGLLASGIYSGELRLYSYPAQNLACPYKSYNLHSRGGVSSCAFTVDEEYLVTVGKTDRVIVVWKVSQSSSFPEPSDWIARKLSQSVSRDDDGNILGDFMSSFIHRTVNFFGSVGIGNKQVETVTLKQLSTILLSISGMYVPNLSSKQISSQSELVFYSGIGNISAHFGKLLGTLDREKVAYHLAQLSRHNENVALPTKIITALACSQCRKFILAGSSSSTEKGCLAIFDSMLHKPISYLFKEVNGGVAAVAFSSDSKLCTSLANDWGHTLSVFRTINGNWMDAELVFNGVSSPAGMSLVTFVSYPPSFNAGVEVVVAGSQYIKFFKINERNASSVTSCYEAGTITTLTSVQSSGNIITGDSEGEVWLWSDSKKQRLLTKHSDAVSCLKSFSTTRLANPLVPVTLARPLTRGVDRKAFTKYSADSRTAKQTANSTVSEYGFVSASKDVVRVFKRSNINDQYTSCHEVDVANIFNSGTLHRTPMIRPFVVGVSVDSLCSRFIISASNNSTVEYTLNSGAVQEIVHGPSNPIKFFAAHPADENIVVSVSQDNVVRVINLCSSSANKTIGSLSLSSDISSLQFVSNDELVVGLKITDNKKSSFGAFVIVELVNLNIDSSDKREIVLAVKCRMDGIGNGAVLAAKFSPDMQLLAVANEDGSVYFFSRSSESIENPFIAENELKVHTSFVPVTALDFSSDGKYLRTFGDSSSGDKKVLVNYFDIAITKEMKLEAMKTNSRPEIGQLLTEVDEITHIRDVVKWSSCSSPATIPLRTVYVEDVSRSLISICNSCLSNDGTLAVAGYSDGTVKVFEAGTSDSRTIKQLCEMSSHSNGGARAVFLGGRSDLVCSCGVNDGLMMVWSLK